MHFLITKVAMLEKLLSKTIWQESSFEFIGICEMN